MKLLMNARMNQHANIQLTIIKWIGTICRKCVAWRQIEAGYAPVLTRGTLYHNGFCMQLSCIFAVTPTPRLVALPTHNMPYVYICQPCDMNRREIIIGTYLCQFRATIPARHHAQDIYSVSLQIFLSFETLAKCRP